MEGGLLAHPRKCPSCGTALQQQLGDWALSQVIKDTSTMPPRLVHTGMLFTCLLYRCPNCKRLDLVDAE